MQEHTAVATLQPPLLQQLRNSDRQTDPQRPMAVTFKKATRTQAKARVALAGPSGSGKTYTALLVAKALGTLIAVVDTERGSSSKYAGEAGMPEFDVVELESFSPERYIEAIQAAEAAGYDVLIIDSLSHAWVGKEGVLEQVDIARARSKTGNPFTEGWRYASPLHNRLLDTMLQSKLDLIVTMRSKTKYVLEEHNGRQMPKQVGMELVQRDGIEYEWDIVGELDKENTLVITKSRCKALSGKSFAQPGAELGEAVKTWLRMGAPSAAPDERPTLQELFAPVKLETIPQSPSVAVPAEESPPEGHPTADHISSLVEMARSCGVDLTSFGDHMRRLMQLADDTKITKKFLRESITMAQYEVAWQHYSEMLKKQVEEDVSDDPPPGENAFPGGPEAITGLAEEGPQTETSEPDSAVDAPADDPHATPQQIAALKRLAQQVGDEAYADVQDMLDHHPEGLVLGVYEDVKQRLRARKAAKKEDTPVHQQG
jgi:AAA domain